MADKTRTEVPESPDVQDTAAGHTYEFRGDESAEELQALVAHSTDRMTRRRAASRLQGGRGHVRG